MTTRSSKGNVPSMPYYRVTPLMRMMGEAGAMQAHITAIVRHQYHLTSKFSTTSRRLKADTLAVGTPHFFLPIAGSPADGEQHDHFVTLLKSDPDSSKPIPVIHTLGLSTSLSWSDATASMDEWVSLADTSSRNVPFLWIGPNAAGHRKPPGQILSQGNNALWHYTLEMAKEAHSRELDALGMYNLTLQANSWDGSGYGLRVALVQAMMVSPISTSPLRRMITF